MTFQELLDQEGSGVLCVDCLTEDQKQTIIALAALRQIQFIENEECVAPVITTGSVPNATWNVPYSQQLANSGSTAVYTVTSGALPPGITLSTTGLLSGTSTGSGAYNFTITATNFCGSDPQAYSMSVSCVAPVITTTILPVATVGTAYSYTIAASGNPSTFAVTSGSLPAGLALSTAGVLSGTPTTAATTAFTVTATNACGSDPQAYSFVVNAACVPPDITTTTLPEGVIGTAYSQTISATGTTSNFTHISGALPPGLSLTGGGVVTGTPTGPAGDYLFVVRATNACGTDIQHYHLIIVGSCVAPVITTTSLPAGTVGTAYNQTVAASGTASTRAITSGSLPTGLSMSTAGVITGTPSAAGTFNFTVTATNGCGSDPQAFSVVISASCVAPVITTGSLPAGTTGTAYNQTIVASGTASTFAVTSGSLPNGLALSAGGVLSGTPTVAATFNFTVTATNACGSDPQAYSVVISTCVVPVITDTVLTPGTVGVLFTQTINANGTGPITFAVTAGTITPGLSLSSGGVLSGTPTTAGTFGFTVTATNACGSDPQVFSHVISAAAPTMYKGTWAGPAQPVFVAADFTTPSASFETIASSSPASANGAHVFAASAGTVRPTFWIADSLTGGSPTFKVGGTPFDVVLDPGPNTPYQNLTIAGIAGKVYKSFNTISGGITIDVAGAVP